MANITDVKLPDNSQYDLKDNVSGYASKVLSATTDDLAKLTATGDLADSGKKLGDLVLKSDVKDVLNSTSTTDPLSAKQGKVLNDNIEAIVDVYGAKNICDLEGYLNKCNVAFTKSGNAYSFTMNSTFYTSIFTLLNHDTDLTVTATSITGDCYISLIDENGTPVGEIAPGSSINVTQTFSKIKFAPALELTTVTITGLMIRDARILDPTFAPYAETNLQLTQNKAERADLATLNLTGSTNTTGAQIDAGTFFYLNGQFCKAKTNIAVNATFTENTNYEPTNIGKELSDQTITAITGSSASYTIYQNAQYSQSYYMKRGGFVYVNILVTVVASESSWTPITGNLPQMSGFTTINPPFMGSDNTTDHVAILLQNGVLYAMGGTVGNTYAICFSYPA